MIAPLLKAEGEKNRDSLGWGKAIRTHELESIMMNLLGDREIALLKLMLFFTGNAQDGKFRVAEETVLKRCKISLDGYKKGRKKLIDRGWIKKTEGEIIICYDAIYQQAKDQGVYELWVSEKPKMANAQESLPKKVSEKPSLVEGQEYTPSRVSEKPKEESKLEIEQKKVSEKPKMYGVSEKPSDVTEQEKLQLRVSETPSEDFSEIQFWVSENTHNNIIGASPQYDKGNKINGDDPLGQWKTKDGKFDF